MQVPFISKWIEDRRMKQVWRDYEAAKERDRLAREAEDLDEQRYVESDEFEADYQDFDGRDEDDYVCEYYCGQFSCDVHGDEARDNLREIESIFAQ